MSYLDRVRLHFAGEFRADVSTVNNDATHYDSANFSEDFQKPQTDTAKRLVAACWYGGMATRKLPCDTCLL